MHYVNKEVKDKQLNSSWGKKKKCERCGMSNHTREQCRYKNATCYRCQKTGHLQSECRSKPVGRGQGHVQQSGRFPQSQSGRFPQSGNRNQGKFVPGRQKGSGSIRNVDDADEDETGFVDSLFNIDSKSSSAAIKVMLQVDGQDLEMELDTGAAVSIINFDVYETMFKHLPLQPVQRPLHTYTGTKLEVAGEVLVNVCYKGQEKVLPLIVVKTARKAPPLLGRTWLAEIQLDWPQIMSHGQYAISTDLGSVLQDKYAEVFKQELGTVKGFRATLHAKEDVVPVFHKARNVPYALRPAVEQELDRMQREGVIVPVDFSEWATPLVCIPKADGRVRLCGDYKVTVNKNIHCDRYPIPTPTEVFSKLVGGKKFSKIDLKCAYQQILLDDESQRLVTINTHRGLFAYTRLPFGISSSPAIWQRFIEQVLAGLDGVCAIMDDVLVTGANDEEHMQNLDKLFARFTKFGLTVKREKCAFMQDEVVYMGRKLSAKGIQPTQDKVDAIRQAPAPKNVTELRSWLGMVNFQAQFLPHLSTMLHPLNALLGDIPWDWTDACEKSFNAVKEAISSDKLLTHYDPSKRVELSTDASPYGIGAVICHIDDEGRRLPIAYASRSLNKHEKGYAQLDKEALAIMFGVQRFRTYLYGRKFIIRTDHKPLERILGPKTAIPTLAAQRLQRWAIMLSAFDYELKFIAGKDNVVADALSRLPLPETETGDDALYNIAVHHLNNLPVTSEEVRKCTRTDPILSRVLDWIKTGNWPKDVDEQLKPFLHRRHELTVEQDCILWGYRVVIPKKLQEDVLLELHTAHAGIVRMKEIARSHVWWFNIDRVIEGLVKQCVTCQQTRNVPTVAPLMPWVWPRSPWNRIHIDFAQKDKQDFLVIVDAHSKWPEIIMMNSTTTSATIRVLRDLFSKYGIPNQVVSDNGPQFSSEEFRHFLKMNGVKQVLVAPYHAASNGAAERMVQSFKRSLSASKSTNRSTQQCLDSFLLTYRSTKHPTTGQTPASLFLGRELRTRMSLVKPSVATTVEGKQTEQRLHHDKSPNLREFYPGEQVLVKDFRVEGTWHSGTIAERTAPKSYIVSMDDGRVWKRHIDQMRRADVNSSSTGNEQFHHEPRMAERSLRRNDNQRYGEKSGLEIAPQSQPGGVENSETVQTENERLESNSGESTPQAYQQPRRSGRMRREPARLISEM